MKRRDLLKAVIATPVAAACGVPMTVTKSGHRSGKCFGSTTLMATAKVHVRKGQLVTCLYNVTKQRWEIPDCEVVTIA